MIRFLSHPLSAANPVYGSPSEPLELKEVMSIRKGDSSQVYWIGFENHWGTHVDCPAHFFSEAPKITDYKADTWFFHRPQVLLVDLEPGQLLGVRGLAGKIRPETDLVLFQSGWWRWRGEDRYSCENPGVDPELGTWLRKEYPSVRAIGFDWISLSSYLDRETGRRAHRAFLDPDTYGHPILILEDMDLSADLSALKEVWAAPLRVEEADSAPCTVIGVFV